MDIGDPHGGSSSGYGDEEKKKPRELPDDLPRSLNDRRSVPTHFPIETEMYDAWQGKVISMAGSSMILTIPRTITVPDGSSACQTSSI
jgi:hypothetical protein